MSVKLTPTKEQQEILDFSATGKSLLVNAKAGAAKTYRDPQHPEVILTTCHKAKGLEWDKVILADDFPDVLEEDVEGEEVNLLYVALTRAKKELVINHNIKDFLDFLEIMGSQEVA